MSQAEFDDQCAMSDRYTGLPPQLKKAVFERDQYRCRWCGSTNRYGYDVHHIQYRRGYTYDVLNNLVTLDRLCHGFVHDSYLIPKTEAQEVLTFLISDEGQGTTGLAYWRALRKEANTDKPTDEVDSKTEPTRGVGRLIQLD